MRRDVFAEMGLSDSSLHTEDYDFYLRLLLAYECGFWTERRSPSTAKWNFHLMIARSWRALWRPPQGPRLRRYAR